MSNNREPVAALRYKAVGRKDIGRPRRRASGQVKYAVNQSNFGTNTCSEKEEAKKEDFLI